MSKWIEHLNKHYQEKKRTNPKYTFTQAMKDAAKTYKKSKKGGAMEESTTEPGTEVMEETVEKGTEAHVTGGAKKNKSRKSKRGGSVPSSTAPAQLADTAAPFMGGAKKRNSRKSKKGGNAIIEGAVSERLFGHASSAVITK